MNRNAATETHLPTTAPRVHYVDWLRVLAVLLLFPFHTLRVFNYEDFYVKGAELSQALNYVLGFISTWHMQLLFFLAGASTLYALRKRSGGGYLLERVKRLLVPFMFGFLVLIPPQTWLGGRFNSGYSGSFWHYLTSGDFLVFNVKDGGDYYGGFGIGHLWFIMVLFLLSVIVLPVLLGGRHARGKKIYARISRVLSHPAGWLVVGAFIMIFEALPDPTGLGFFYYLAYFLLGYLAMNNEAFPVQAERFRRPAMAIGLALCIFWVASGSFRDALPDPSWQRTLLSVLGGIGTWSMIVGLLGYGRRYLNRTSPVLSYLAEGSYPVYLLHQTVIVIVAFYLVGMAGPWPVQWLLLLVASVAATFALYEGIRRTPVRVLFGMKLVRPQSRRAMVVSAHPEAAGRALETVPGGQVR
jgi:glucans biosynthesis protein C